MTGSSRLAWPPWPLLAGVIGWSAYATLSLSYLVFVLALVLALVTLSRQQAWARLRQAPGVLPLALLWLWLALSAAWSPAAADDMVAHLWSITLLLTVPVLALACPAQAARSGLQHFVWASGVAALLVITTRLGWLPVLPPWQRIVDAGGNQRIAMSLWLALGAAFALHDAAAPAAGQGPARRMAAVAAALLCMAAIALQDRRSGMVMLLPLLAGWATLSQPTTLRRAGVLAVIVVAALGAWQVADGVRARFAEGLHELRQLPPPETVASSWGQRLYMIDITARLVAERPLAGHGLGSWPALWQRHTPAGSALREHSTPHNEYLLLATQGGLPAVALLLAALAARLRACWTVGLAALPALQVWLTVALGGLFNAILRDAKFELTLLLLAALATAAARDQASGQARKPSAAAPGLDPPSSSPR